jgi:inorganic pyrophosphatase
MKLFKTKAMWFFLAAAVAVSCSSSHHFGLVWAGEGFDHEEPYEPFYVGVRVDPDAGESNTDASKPFYPEQPLVFVNTPEWTNPLDFAVRAQRSSDDDTALSYWHDIATYPEPVEEEEEEESSALIVNFVPEMLKGSIGKLEIMKGVGGNPIMFDTKEVKDSAGRVLYERPRYVAYGATPFTYGAIPQTWESSVDPDPITNIVGDNDPIDALDISSVVPEIGHPYQAKVLGSLGLIDDEETDWKVVLINAKDPMAETYNTILDVPQETREMIFTYFRDKPVAVGEAPGVFWPDLTEEYDSDVWFDSEQTKEIIGHTKQQYQDLISDCSRVTQLEFAYWACESGEEDSEGSEDSPILEPCCKALKADCLSCSEGVSEEEYCGKNPDTIGCEETAFDTKDTEDQPAVPCCMGLVAECLSCSAGLTVQEYCGKNPDTSGCEEIAFETDADPVQDP